MLFYRCTSCGKIVWFWQSSGTVTFQLKTGGTKVLHFCIDCGMEIALKASGKEE